MDMDRQQFIQAIEAAQRGDNTSAQGLSSFEDSNIVQYYILLCTLLSDATVPETLRLQCIILLSNTVSARSSKHQKVLANRWLQIEPELRKSIRAMLLQMLDSKSNAFRETAVKAISSIAITEIQVDQWQELLPQLTAASASSEVNIFIRISSITIIGECCAALSHDCKPLGQHTSQILNSIAICVGNENLDLKLNGLEALNNTIKFSSKHFENATECQFLMELMTKSATPQHPLDQINYHKQFKIQASAWDCLSTVVGHYYTILQPFIKDIFECSVKSIQQSLVQIDDIDLRDAIHLGSIQAIEFWFALATNEERIQKEIDEIEENDEEKNIENLNYTNHSLIHIVPLLFKCLCLHGDDPNDESYNITLSAMNCLTAFASAQTDPRLFPILLPEIEKQISSQDWHYRDAALTSLGCLLLAPSIDENTEQDLYSPMLNNALGTVIQLLNNDQSPFVQISAAWCLKQYCSYQTSYILQSIDIVINNAILPALRDPMTKRRVTENLCRALYDLCQLIWDYQDSIGQDNDNGDDEILSAASNGWENPLSPHFELLVQALLAIPDQASTSSTLIVNSYEALGSLIQCGAGNDNPNLHQLLPVLRERLRISTQQFNAAATTTNQQNNSQHLGSFKVQAQGFICGALAHLIGNLSKEIIQQQSADLLNVFFSVLHSDPTITSEALTGIESIIYSLEIDFLPHIEQTYTHLLQLINTSHDIGTILSRAFVTLGAGLSKTRFCNELLGDAIVQSIMNILQADAIDSNGKTAAIDCLCDLVEVCQDSFFRYYNSLTSILFSAGDYSLTSAHQYLDIDQVNYLLRIQISLTRALDAFLVNLVRANTPPEGLKLIGNDIQRYITYGIKVLEDGEATIISKDDALIMLGDAFDAIPKVAPLLGKEILQSQIPGVIRKIAHSSRGALRKTAMATLRELSSLK